MEPIKLGTTMEQDFFRKRVVNEMRSSLEALVQAESQPMRDFITTELCSLMSEILRQSQVQQNANKDLIKQLICSEAK